MVDNMNPNTQFHPYQRETSVPVAERPETGFNSFLTNLGIDPTRVRSIGDQMKSLKSLDRARAYAKANPAKVLGGLAAIAIGIGLLRGRRS
ncbi:MAG TPA: hypothetical protein VN380_04575 [Thermoanaerobaculia bacterium]|jgi:hypothetical protein|nr:hypothetical protein [Thermoanaerobaculia bacterium]